MLLLVVAAGAAAAQDQHYVESEQLSLAVDAAEWRREPGADEPCLILLRHRAQPGWTFSLNRTRRGEVAAPEQLDAFAAAFDAKMQGLGYQVRQAPRPLPVGVDGVPGREAVYGGPRDGPDGLVWVLLFVRADQGYWCFGHAPAGAAAARAAFAALPAQLSFPPVAPARQVALAAPDPVRFTLPAGWRVIPPADAAAPAFQARRLVDGEPWRELTLRAAPLGAAEPLEAVFRRFDEQALAAGWQPESAQGPPLRPVELLMDERPVRWAAYRRPGPTGAPIRWQAVGWLSAHRFWLLSHRAEAPDAEATAVVAREAEALRESLRFPAPEGAAELEAVPAEVRRVELRARVLGADRIHLGLLFTDAGGTPIAFEGRRVRVDLRVLLADEAAAGGAPAGGAAGAAARFLARRTLELRAARDGNWWGAHPGQRLAYEELRQAALQQGVTLGGAAAFRGLIEVTVRTADGRTLTARAPVEPPAAPAGE